MATIGLTLPLWLTNVSGKCMVPSGLGCALWSLSMVCLYGILILLSRRWATTLRQCSYSMFVLLPLSMYTLWTWVWRMQVVIMSRFLGSQFDGLGSSIGNLILSMLPDNTLVSSFALWGSALLRGLKMLKMYSFFYMCLLACFWAWAFFWSGSKLDLRSFVMSERSPFSFFYSIYFFGTVHSLVSWVLLLWYS